MKGKKLNPNLEVGDVIICYYMEGESSVPPGTKGVVISKQQDPFESDSELIGVEWENGSTLNLLSGTDAWKKIDENINESDVRNSFDFMIKNEDLLDNFDWRFLKKYLYKLREIGIVNMYGAAPLLYAGKDHIDRYYGEGREDDEDFQEFLEMSEESKHKIIQGVVKFMKKHNIDLDNMNMVNRFAAHFSQKMIGLYISLSPFEK